MDSQDIRILRLLEEVGSEEQPSQRELARKLGISLGLVNAFLKRLARKGYFKITNLPANRVRYLLTPKGMAEKTRLTCEYIHYSFSYYRQTRTKLRNILAEQAAMGQRRMIFWGKGELAEIAYISLQEIPGLEFVAMVEEDGRGEKIFGKTVLTPEELVQVSFDRILITTITSGDEIRTVLHGLGIADQKILSL